MLSFDIAPHGPRRDDRFTSQARVFLEFACQRRQQVDGAVYSGALIDIASRRELAQVRLYIVLFAILPKMIP
jgi:hypothetical protein